MASLTLALLKDTGDRVDDVRLSIDYEIIEHFSKHLYGSPNKAVEELVANGFDALARWVRVYLPGHHAKESVLVWDDGTAMDIGGLKELWQLADSPKRDVPDRVRAGRGMERKLIGKFGIGKLASYTVGDAIAHLCRQGDQFLLVTVDYSEVTGKLKGSGGGYESPIRRVSLEDARELARGLFNHVPDDFDVLFNEETWTLAVVTALKTDSLRSGRLRWVIGNGMPHRPDFQVWVDGERVVPKLKKDGLEHEWEVGSDDIRVAVQAACRRAELIGPADEIESGTEVGLDPSDPKCPVPYVVLPSLGKVFGVVRLYKQSLLQSADTSGRSYGFFVMVRGRLVNVNDETLLLDDPEYRTFYRSQFVLHTDGLDRVLLADRERIQSDTPEARALKALQRAVYTVARRRQTDLDVAAAENAAMELRLPTYSLEYFVEPLSALFASGASAPATMDLRNPEIRPVDMGEDGSVSGISAKGGFDVNAQHPYYQSLVGQFGTGKRGRDTLRLFEQLAVSETLFHGHLIDIGVDAARVATIVGWRDGMYRALAMANELSTFNLIRDLRETSYKGDKEFEVAITRVLEAMGFRATQHGESGQKDVLVVVPTVDSAFKMTVEAKGSKNVIGVKEARISNAHTHRKNAGASHAVVVAREFEGFKTYDPSAPPMVLQECRDSVDPDALGEGANTPCVSVMTVENLVRLLQVVRRYFYPVHTFMDVFKVVESPDEKSARIEKLGEPFKAFDHLGLLDAIWERQGGAYDGQAIGYRDLYFNDERYKSSMDFDEFEQRLSALARLAMPMADLDQTTKTVKLLAAPDRVAAKIVEELSREPEAPTSVRPSGASS